MRQRIALVDYSRFSVKLQETFGNDISLVVVKPGNDFTKKEFYIEYDSVTQQQIDQALQLAQEDNLTELANVKQRVYDKMQYAMNKLLRLRTQTYSDGEYQAASTWLQNQSDPCPVNIIGISLKENITPLQAAQQIVNDYQSNVAYKNALNQLFSDTITFVSQSQDVEACIEKIRINIEAMRSL